VANVRERLAVTEERLAVTEQAAQKVDKKRLLLKNLKGGGR
jgi:hypothetical protein